MFNNDIKGLTLNWPQELDQSDFIWNEKEQCVEKIEGKDTIRVAKGGCVHFGNTVEIVLGNNIYSLDSIGYWLQKAIQISKTFNLKWYTITLNF